MTGQGVAAGELEGVDGDAARRRQTPPATSRRRLLMAGLGLAGLADALYMLAFHEGLIDRIACPFFGEGCAIVGRSSRAKHFGVPNAAVGALGFAGISTLALWAVEDRAGGPPWRSWTLTALSGSAVAASAYLTWEQGAKVGAWCFWCLLSAAANAAIFPLAAAETIAGLHKRTA